MRQITTTTTKIRVYRGSGTLNAERSARVAQMTMHTTNTARSKLIITFLLFGEIELLLYTVRLDNYRCDILNETCDTSL